MDNYASWFGVGIKGGTIGRVGFETFGIVKFLVCSANKPMSLRQF
jgi:hypothetical protein